MAAGSIAVYQTYVDAGAGKFPFQQGDKPAYEAYTRLEQRPRVQREVAGCMPGTPEQRPAVGPVRH